MILEYESFLALTTIRRNARSVATIGNVQVTNWSALVGLRCLLEPAEAFAGVQSGTFTVQTGRIANRNASFLRIHDVTFVAGTLAGSCARTMATFRVTERNTDALLILVAPVTAAPIWSCATTVGASNANWFTRSERIFLVSFAANGFPRRVVLQRATINGVVTCVDVFRKRKNASMRTQRVPPDVRGR